MDEIRVAVVGYGLAGRVFHAPLIQAHEGLRLVSVVTSNQERQRQVRQACPGVLVFDRVDQLWQRAADHDLVVIATPTESHLPLAKRAIEAGLAVVVDKPFAVDAASAAELVAAAEAKSVPLTVFQNRRLDSDQLTLRRLLAEGALGQVLRYESRFERWQPQVRSDRWRDVTPADRGGGVLLDLGSHLVDQALHLFGPAEVVHADVRSVRGGVSDDFAFVVLAHGNQEQSHLSVGAMFGAPGPRLRVVGTAATFVVYDVDNQEEQLRAGLRPSHAAYGIEDSDGWGWLATGGSWLPVAPEPGAWPQFYADVHRALTEGTPLPVDPRDAVETQRLLDEARALATGRAEDAWRS
ncbi:MAG: oxidoreductase [Streptosporangiales bacterium]|nr:oxidoreductase [Streptosporangiales bacterium]